MNESPIICNYNASKMKRFLIKTCKEKKIFLSDYWVYTYQMNWKQSNEADLVHKQNPKVWSSLNKISSYSSGKEEMEQKIENPIQIRILVCLHQTIIVWIFRITQGSNWSWHAYL